MIEVKLIADTSVEPTVLASHAAKICYTSDAPELGSLIDVKSRLFNPGHHTTLQHNSFTFSIENLPVSAVCLGLHLNAPYYNTDQRSGRFSKMYNSPDFDSIRENLKNYYSEDLTEAMGFIEKGARIYADNIGKLTDIAADEIKKERPFASEKYIEQNAPKFAQEQLRMFISMAAPTGLDFTINTTALCALYRTAWSPELMELTQVMVDKVVEKNPEIAYMFGSDSRVSNRNWTPTRLSAVAGIKTEPALRLLSVHMNTPIVHIEGQDSVDVLPFSPYTMSNKMNYIETEVEMSCATMGQDQRHRSIDRSAPELTGDFYLPPLLKMGGLEETAQQFMQEYLDLSTRISPALAMAIMPYGAMVKYQKRANLNALAHEQAKRTCWCAQEEIYHLSTQLRYRLAEHPQGKEIIALLAPPCFAAGKCCEGPRFCGRQLKREKVADYFCNRRV